MTIAFPTRYTYIQRDEHDNEAFDAEEIMDAIAEDLLRDGDIDLALQRAFRWGFQTRDGNHIGGMRDLMQKLRDRRKELLEQSNLGDLFGDLREELQSIVDQEARTLADRLTEARAAGQDAAEHVLQKQQERLQAVPPGAPERLHALQSYDFVNQEAQARFDALLENIQKQVAERFFNSMKDAAQRPDENLQEMRDFLKDINDAFDAHNRGEPVDLDRINNRWAQQLGGRVNSMEELEDRMRQRMQASQQLMNLLTPEQRRELADMLNAAAEGSDLAEQLQRLQQHLPPSHSMRPGQGEGQPLSLDMAMQLMDELGKLDQLEMQLGDVGGYGDVPELDPDLVEQVLGKEDREWLNRWESIQQQLQDAGFVNQNGRHLELTPRAIRKIGEKALQDIFADLSRGMSGQHDLRHAGRAGELGETSSPWQFGDPFTLDLPRTVMNGVVRNGIGAPVALRPDDFEVIDRDVRTSTATVLLIDMSRSMLHNGCWDAAKRAALALDTLIRSKFPRDMLELVGFSATAERLSVEDLPSLEWNEYNFGTNLQHGLQIGRELLAKERGRFRQMIVITDGEPTAHIADGEVFFDYPPRRETFEETLKEVVRCTRDDIRINTFLLEQTPYLRKFIDDMMRINHGRVINASARKLGSYMLTDFMQGRSVERHA
jgi:uncharacterized protein with von Willebrand factor type A (vWA) domain